MEFLDHGIRGYVGNIPVFASAASETKYNIMSAEFARSYGLEIHPSGSSLINGNGRDAIAIGKVSLDWQFEGEVSRDHKIEFLVLPNCSKPITLGHDFLDFTGTLTTNWHRLKTQAMLEEQTPCLHILGDPPLSIAGRVHKVPTYALPASGCEINLISERYITSRGLQRKVNRDDKRWVRLADGALVETTGELHSRWAFGAEKWLNVWPVKFSVLPDCPYDIVLGRSFLYGADAFLSYSECFRRVSPTSSDPLRSGICLAPLILQSFTRHPGIRNAVRMIGDPSIDEELKRRAFADHFNGQKTGPAKIAADEAEQERRAKWNAGRHSSSHEQYSRNNVMESQDDHILTGITQSSQDSSLSVRSHSLLAEQRRSFSDHDSHSNHGNEWDHLGH